VRGVFDVATYWPGVRFWSLSQIRLNRDLYAKLFRMQRKNTIFSASVLCKHWLSFVRKKVLMKTMTLFLAIKLNGQFTQKSKFCHCLHTLMLLQTYILLQNIFLMTVPTDFHNMKKKYYVCQWLPSTIWLPTFFKNIFLSVDGSH